MTMQFDHVRIRSAPLIKSRDFDPAQHQLNSLQPFFPHLYPREFSPRVWNTRGQASSRKRKKNFNQKRNKSVGASQKIVLFRAFAPIWYWIEFLRNGGERKRFNTMSLAFFPFLLSKPPLT